MHVLRVSICFAFLMTASSAMAAPPTGAEAEEIREEIGQLKSQAAEIVRRLAVLESKLAQFDDAQARGKHAPESSDKRNARLVFAGHCPVRLVRHQLWVMGSKEHQVTYEGCVYWFAGSKEKLAFQKNPSTFAPFLAGNDPVLWIEKKQLVAGHRRHGVFFLDRVVLFSNEASLQRFSRAPDRYMLATVLTESEPSTKDRSADAAKLEVSETKETTEVNRPRRLLRRRVREVFRRIRSRVR